jgi:hypothetical protein
MWIGFGAVSTQKVTKDLNKKLPIKDLGYMGPWSPRVWQNYKVIYGVLEWVLDFSEVYQLNAMAEEKPIIFASYWSRFLGRCYNCYVVHHEVADSFYDAKYSDSYPDYDIFTIYFELARKNPDLLRKIVSHPKLKKKVLIVTNNCSGLNTDKAKCITGFGNMSEGTIKSMMYGKPLLWVSGNEGFGLPPLEASSIGSQVIGFDVPPLNEWYPERDKLYKFVLPKEIRMGGVLNPTFRPEKLDDFIDYINSFEKKVDKDLRDYVTENYTRGKKYKTIKYILDEWGIG